MKHFTPYTTTDLLFSEKRFIQSEICFLIMIFADSIFRLGICGKNRLIHNDWNNKFYFMFILNIFYSYSDLSKLNLSN
jgi:hypothetical protein